MSGPQTPMEPKIAHRRTVIRSQKARGHRTGALAVLASIAVAAGGWWVFTGPAVAIRNVTIKGYGRDDANVLAAYVQRAVGRATMLSLPTDAIRRDLARFAWVSEVNVQRDWPSSVVVTIRQVRPAAVAIPVHGRLGLLSPSGRLLAGVPDSGIPQNLPQIGVTRLPTLLGEPLPDAVERSSIATLAALRQIGSVHVRRLQVRDGGVTAVLDSGMSLRLGSPDDLDAKITAIRTVLPRIPLSQRVAGRYLDVRFPRFAAVGKAQAIRPALVPADPLAAGTASAVGTPPGGATGSTPPPATTTGTSSAPSTNGPAAARAPASSGVAPPPPPPPLASIAPGATPVPSTTTSAPVPTPTASIDPGLRVSP